MATWTFGAESRQKQYDDIMAKQRQNITPENSFCEKSVAYRPYNVERCVYVRWEDSPDSKE